MNTYLLSVIVKLDGEGLLSLSVENLGVSYFIFGGNDINLNKIAQIYNFKSNIL